MDRHEQASSNVWWSKARLWILGGVGLLIIVAAIGLWAYGAAHSGASTPGSTNHVPEDVVKAVGFLVYYPATLPNGYTFDRAEVQNSIVTLVYTFGGSKKLIISEQSKPINIEQVTKTKDVTTSLGSAYIADLNGRQAGFVEAGKTLVIFTSDSQIDGGDLERLMVGLKVAD